MFYIGCHLSAAGGYLKMGETAVAVGANTFQFFTRNPRGGAAKAVDTEDIAAYRRFAEEHGIGRLVAHAPYTLNACSADARVREFAFMTMKDDLERLELLPGNYYNFHPGSHVGQGIETGIGQICALLNAVLTPEQSTTVLLETMAGKGSEIGGRFEELAAIIAGTDCAEKLGVCIDTCHLNDAGYDVVDDFEGVLDEFDRVIGIQRIAAVHVNDSRNVRGARKDRHANIGFGEIGFDALSAFVHHPVLADIVKILETPYVEGHAPYGEEIAMLRQNTFDPSLMDQIRRN